LHDEHDKTYALGATKSEVIEKTGAGDAYTSGFLSAVLSNLSFEEAMIWGSVNAGSVIQKIGAEQGLLTKEEIKDKISSLGDFHPRAI
jgi:sugar/nucleoside kinase (ribokinase family)